MREQAGRGRWSAGSENPQRASPAQRSRQGSLARGAMVFASSAVGCCDAGWVRSRPQGLLGGEQQAASGVRSRPQGRRKQRAAWRRPVDLDVPAAEAEVELRPRRGPHGRAGRPAPPSDGAGKAHNAEANNAKVDSYTTTSRLAPGRRAQRQATQSARKRRSKSMRTSFAW